MDLWAVKYASRRSKDAGYFRPFSRLRRPAPGAFWPRARVPAKEGCRLGELNRLGGGRGRGYRPFAVGRMTGAVLGRTSRGGLGSSQ
jgi:hypothetical protein